MRISGIKLKNTRTSPPYLRQEKVHFLPVGHSTPQARSIRSSAKANVDFSTISKSIADRQPELTCSLVAKARTDVLHTKDEAGRNLLHLELDQPFPNRPNFMVIEMLITAGLNPNDRDFQGRAPLELASYFWGEKGNWALFEFLVERGADINAKVGGEQISPLDKTFWLGKEYIGKRLLDVALISTIMHNLGVHRMLRLVEMLLEKGAKPSLIDINMFWHRHFPEPAKIKRCEDFARQIFNRLLVHVPRDTKKVIISRIFDSRGH